MLNSLIEMQKTASENGEKAATIKLINIFIDKKKQDSDSTSIEEIVNFIQGDPSRSQVERLFDILVLHEKPFDVAAYYIKHFIELDVNTNGR